ncbi:MAG: hypothetical protein JRF39_01860 [Deltaproteobacteria bacterium]|jgi:hypothetical protein|nr:hypothetical protein [Deltaproteobacteria bacterium]
MKKTFFSIIAFIIFFCMVRTSANADWINLSGAENSPNIAEIHIQDDYVKIELEIFVDDMVTFDRLIPDAFFKGTAIKRPSLADRMRLFSDQDFQIITDKGQKLQAELKRIEPRFRKERPSPFAGKINPYTLQLIPGPPEDKRVFYAELVYPFAKKPASLTIIPPLDEKYKISKVPIGFMTYHNGVPINDFRYLSGPSKVTLDWADPWYSTFDQKALKRWQRGSVMSFLYIEPYEVRHEILARVKDLSAWIDLGLRGDEFIETDENETLKKRVGEFFLKQDKVLIDGKQLRPILDRTAFVKYSMTGSTFLVQPEQLPINTAMVGVIITYLTKGIPQEVTNTWDLWSDRIQKVPADAIDPAGPFPSYVTPDENVLTWKNFLKTYQMPTVAQIELDESLTTMKIPLASVLCLLALVPVALQIRKRRQNAKPVGLHIGLVILFMAGSALLYPLLKVAVAKPAVMAPKMTDKDAVFVLNSLLKNIYRSFDFREEEDVYDRLATSVSGDLLSEIYLQNRKSLVVTQAGGARARVKEVEILNVDVNHLDHRPLGLLFRTKWTAMGSVGHWGHIHIRKNQYEANITVEPVDGAWKIIGLELLEEKRIDSYAKPKA